MTILMKRYLGLEEQPSCLELTEQTRVIINSPWKTVDQNPRPLLSAFAWLMVFERPYVYSWSTLKKRTHWNSESRIPDWIGVWVRFEFLYGIKDIVPLQTCTWSIGRDRNLYRLIFVACLNRIDSGIRDIVGLDPRSMQKPSNTQRRVCWGSPGL